MYKTTKRRTARSGRPVVRTMSPWSFGLHRTIEAAAKAGAICAFSLQMRNRLENHQPPNLAGDNGNLNGSRTVSIGCDTQLRDAERREESP